MGKCKCKAIIFADGKLEKVIVNFMDITERKQVEEKLIASDLLFRTTFEQDSFGMALRAMGPVDSRWLEVNDKFCKILGYSREELLNLTSIDISIPEERQEAIGFNKKLLNGEIKSYSREKQYVRKDGEIVWVNIWISAVYGPDGKPNKVISVVQNIDERKKLEDQLRQSQRMEAIGQLTGGVAHDFNNLLAVMIGNAEMLILKDMSKDKLHQHIDNIIDAVDRASSLTDRLLAFSRQQALSPVSSDVITYVDGLEDMLRRTLGETIDFNFVHTPDLWPAIIDPHQFENALINLALNARDAMPDGGKLTIETANVTLDETYAEQHEEVQPGDYVEVAVTDTGTGMASEVLEKVFEPFFTTKEVGKGSGLGLSMVFGFAKQSNGHLSVYSEVGEGTTVKLYMPRSANKEINVDASDDTKFAEPGLERILVVEDDESVRSISVSILSEQGYDVVAVVDGNEAIEQLKGNAAFDLLFTDVILPGGMNGVEIAKQAEKLQPHIKVLYTTGYTENSIVHDGKLDRGITLVSKPYRRAELLEKVRNVLDSESD